MANLTKRIVKEVEGAGHSKTMVGDQAVKPKAGDGLALDAKQGIKQKHTEPVHGSDGHGKGSSGLSRITNPGGNADEFGMGIIGANKEMDKLQTGGNQDGLGDETLLYGGGYFEKEKAGLEDGVSLREEINPDVSEPNYNYDVDPLTGNAPERKVGRANNYTVGGKRGNKFLVGEM